MTQAQMAKILNCHKSLISLLQSCSRHCSFPLAKKLARITKTKAELWVRGGTGTPETRRAAIKAWAAISELNGKS